MDSLGSMQSSFRPQKTRSLTIAGRKNLECRPSAIGKAVARMEGTAQACASPSSTRSITLNREGALFLERCRRSFRNQEAAEA